MMEGLIVSILTRPEGRVQRDMSFLRYPNSSFQSSPAPKDGCNAAAQPPKEVLRSFNPHPPRRTGATPLSLQEKGLKQVSILTRPEGRVQHKYRVI